MGRERPNQAPIQGHQAYLGLMWAVRKQAKAKLLDRVAMP